MDISVVIINYHSSEYTIKCIKSILEQTKGIDFEIIVVDNNSNTEDLETLEKYISKSSGQLWMNLRSARSSIDCTVSIQTSPFALLPVSV